MKKGKLFKALSPWAWYPTFVYGCNLKCGHCACRLMKPGDYKYMDMETWIKLLKIISKVTPCCRIEIASWGEPTLHPKLFEMLRMGRKICPYGQFQITTNGTKIKSGEITYRKLFEAGVNIVYTDMYGDRNKFFSLAKESGVQYYEYYNKPVKAPSAWLYKGPELKLVILQEHPGNWPQSRLKANLLGTWLNNLDWEAAKRFNLKPLKRPIQRRCNQPFRYVSITYDGKYLMCCQDAMNETAGNFSDVSTGVKGFTDYWFGEKVQKIRRELERKNRAGVIQCARCNITFSRCDMVWGPDCMSQYWDGEKWNKLEETRGRIDASLNGIIENGIRSQV